MDDVLLDACSFLVCFYFVFISPFFFFLNKDCQYRDDNEVLRLSRKCFVFPLSFISDLVWFKGLFVFFFPCKMSDF